MTILQKIKKPTEEDVYSAIDITAKLQDKYSQWLKPDIVSVRIVQLKERFWLEITQEEESAGYLVNQTIKRTDLGFICSGDNDFFSPKDDVSINASKFLHEFDSYSIINTTDLFHEAGCHEINDEYHKNKTR